MSKIDISPSFGCRSLKDGSNDGFGVMAFMVTYSLKTFIADNFQLLSYSY